MDLQLQQKIVVQTLEDAKGQDIQVFDTQPLTSLFDRVVIVSATSGRHTRALADQLGRKAKEYGIDIVATEGEDGGEWVLIDQIGRAHVCTPVTWPSRIAFSG